MKKIVLALAVIGCGEIASSDSRNCDHWETDYSHTTVECVERDYNKTVVLCDDGYQSVRPGCVTPMEVRELLQMRGCHTKNWCFDEY